MCTDEPWVPSPMTGNAAPLGSAAKGKRPKQIGLLAAHRRAQKPVPQPKRKR